ncbi:hypothetical protein QFZ73_005197 [Peribacillus sp. V2I11]|nr:hypothetical protein [Peribacillus sp. V2I11]
MSKTKKVLLTLLGVFSIILAGVVILVFSFTQRKEGPGSS